MAVTPGITDPDTLLMLRVKEGDRAAFEELIERYKQPIINVLHRTLGDATEPEDIAQMVFIQVYKSAYRYEPSARFATWIFTIARNLCLNEIRRRSRHPAESLDSGPADSDEPFTPSIEDRQSLIPADSILQRELQQKIEEALSDLPENQRTAILLFREKDLSYDEISAILGISLSATKSLIHRGRDVLKQKLKPYLRTGEWHL